MRQRLDSTRAVTPHGVVAPASTLLDGDRVVAVGRPPEIGDVEAPATRLEGTLAPGFVDLQVNGIGGHQYGALGTGRGDTAAALLASGVTAHCPTVTTRPWDRYAGAMKALAGPVRAPVPKSLGVHLEGPFLSPRRAGAHDPEALVAPTVAAVDELLELADHKVAIMTLAPELPGARDVIAHLRERGVTVSAGHTDATFDRLREAVDVGVSMVTHVFNAQRELRHREPGTAGGALLLGGLYVGIILDGVHVHPEVAALVLRVATGRVLAVTDAVATAGLPPARYEFDDIAVDTSSGAPRLADGTLAGSNLTMDAAFQFVASACGLRDAAAVCATTPARAIGRDDLGVLAPGATADLVLLDGELRVTGVWVDGARAR